MGHFCKKHEWFVQDGETCKYCEPVGPATTNTGTEPSGRDVRSEGVPASGRPTGRPLPQPQYTDVAYYSGYDLLPVCGHQAVTPADMDGWATPEIKQMNGLCLPAQKIKIDPSLRADLSAEMDRQDMKRELFAAIEKMIDAAMSKLRSGG